jgi:signal transduction histidine kinase
LLVHHPEILGSIRKTAPGEFPLDVAGRQLFFSIRYSTLTNRRGGNIGRIVIFQDITEQRRTKKAMYEAERLEGVLEMAGAVCHDLSQPTMASGGYAELLLAGITEDNPLKTPLTRLIDQAETLGNMNKKLLKITQHEPVDLEK